MYKFVVILSIFFVLLIVNGCSKENLTDPASQDIQPAKAVHTFVLTSPEDSRLPAPLVEDLEASIDDKTIVHSAADGHGHNLGIVSTVDPSVLWDTVTTSLGLKAKLPPPLIARAYTLVHVAIYDALVAAHVTNRHDLVDNAVAAGAASKVLRYLFPNDSARIMSIVPSQLTVKHGLALGRVLRSWVLGRTVGELVVLHGKNDGSSAVFTDTIPRGTGIWTGVNPVLPLCGTWKTWITTSGSEFQPEPPYAYGSHEDSVDVQEVYEVSLARTADQIAVVHKWADLPPPTIWNNYLNARVQSNNLSVMASARAHAYLNAAMYDAFVSCWKTKYTYWIARPFQRIPGLVTVINTPNFPTYTSGHSTISGAAAEVMGEVFPSEKSFFTSEADEAAISRLWGGIHFTHDNSQGLVVGGLIGGKTVSVMHSDSHNPLLASH